MTDTALQVSCAFANTGSTATNSVQALAEVARSGTGGGRERPLQKLEMDRQIGRPGTKRSEPEPADARRLMAEPHYRVLLSTVIHAKNVVEASTSHEMMPLLWRTKAFRRYATSKNPSRDIGIHLSVYFEPPVTDCPACGASPDAIAVDGNEKAVNLSYSGRNSTRAPAPFTTSLAVALPSEGPVEDTSRLGCGAMRFRAPDIAANGSHKRHLRTRGMGC